MTFDFGESLAAHGDSVYDILRGPGAQYARLYWLQFSCLQRQSRHAARDVREAGPHRIEMEFSATKVCRKILNHRF